MSKNYKKYSKTRKEFKNDIFIFLRSNKIAAISIINAYANYRLFGHIAKIWEFLGTNHYDVYLDYCDKLSGKCLTGNFDFDRFLCHADKDLYVKYKLKLPIRLMLGDAYSVTITYLKRIQKIDNSIKAKI